jgi:hypothetical protein
MNGWEERFHEAKKGKDSKNSHGKGNGVAEPQNANTSYCMYWREIGQSWRMT